MKNIDQIVLFCMNHPGSERKDIQKGLPHIKKSSLGSSLSYLCKAGLLERKAGGNGYAYYPVEGVSLISKDTAPLVDSGPIDTKTVSLSRFTPRELLAELKSRGYVWDKMYVKQYVEYSKI